MITESRTSVPVHHLDPLRSRTFPYRGRQALLPSGRVAFFDVGEANDVMILVHGLGGDYSHFEHIAPAFARTHRVIGIDMPGCGASAPLRHRHTMERYADVVQELMLFLRIPRATLIGHSAGGQVAATLAARDPSLVNRLVLFNTAGLRGYATATRHLARALFRPTFLNVVLPPASTHILANVFHTRNDYTQKFVVDATQRPKHPLLRNMARVFHDLMPDLLQPSVLQHAPGLEMPVLLLWGGRDRLVPLSSVEHVARLFPRARLEVLHDCGHMPIIEHPEWTTARIREFFETHPLHREEPLAI
jgi:4,5:9,10-diseco-3-hydroxy-5,9,17-trioxoandrosta-1(10),2-diene-4-oate hydrolase